MSTAFIGETLSDAEFLDLLGDQPEHETWELIDGQLRKRPMTTRSPRHSDSFVTVAGELRNWLRSHPTCVGKITGAEVRCRLRSDPSTFVGIDVAYFQGSNYQGFQPDIRYYDGPPVLAVEVLSPTDTHEDVVEKTLLYLECGVKQVWIVDPDLQTVTIHRSDREPQFFTISDTLTAEPELPGFACPVRTFFEA